MSSKFPFSQRSTHCSHVRLTSLIISSSCLTHVQICDLHREHVKNGRVDLPQRATVAATLATCDATHQQRQGGIVV